MLQLLIKAFSYLINLKRKNNNSLNNIMHEEKSELSNNTKIEKQEDDKKVFDFIKANGFSKTNIYSRNQNGHTVLTLALSLNKPIDFIKQILEIDKSGILSNIDWQIEKNIKDKDSTKKITDVISPLEISLMHKSAEQVDVLLKNYADFNQVINSKNQTVYELLTDKENKNKFSDKKWQKVIKNLKKLGAHNNTSTAYIPHAPIESLVFEGSGVRGVVYPGAIKALEEREVMNGLKRVGGVSSGSIAALFVALGHDSKTIKKYLNEVDFTMFMQLSNDKWYHKFGYGILNLIGKCIPKLEVLKSIIPGLFNKSNGTYKLDKAKTWIDERIYEVIGKKNATFKDLVDAKKTNPNIKDLYVELCNLTTRSGEVWSFENHPNARISDVIAASITFPLAFELSTLKVDGKLYSYADGGIYDNAPVLSMFNSEKYLPQGYNFDHKGANPGVYILKVDDKEECENLLWNKGVPRESIKYSKMKFFEDLIKSFGNKQQFVAEQYPTRIIQINDGGVSTLQFKIKDKQKAKANIRGYKTAKNHLENYRSNGSCYFIFDPKKYKDTKDLNLLDRPELKTITSTEKLEKLKSDLLEKIKTLRLYNKEYYKGRSVIMLKRSCYRRLACVNYLLKQHELKNKGTVNYNVKMDKINNGSGIGSNKRKSTKNCNIL